MARTRRQAERRAERRLEGAPGHSASGPFTIRELVFQRMVEETIKYLEMKAIPFGEHAAESAKVATQRGIIRGMSVAFSKMYGNGYQPYWNRQIKQFEKLAVTVAKEFIHDRQEALPHELDERVWWLERNLTERFDALRVPNERRY